MSNMTTTTTRDDGQISVPVCDEKIVITLRRLSAEYATPTAAHPGAVTRRTAIAVDVERPLLPGHAGISYGPMSSAGIRELVLDLVSRAREQGADPRQLAVVERIFALGIA